MLQVIVLVATAIVILWQGYSALDDFATAGNQKDQQWAIFLMLRCIARLLLGFWIAGAGVAIAQFVH